MSLSAALSALQVRYCHSSGDDATRIEALRRVPHQREFCITIIIAESPI